MTRPYEPISCELYSIFELTILHRDALRVSWRAARGMHRVETLFPQDLRTRRHAEYMIARTLEGARRVLRLDRILDAQVIRTPVGA